MAESIIANDTKPLSIELQLESISAYDKNLHISDIQQEHPQVFVSHPNYSNKNI